MELQLYNDILLQCRIISMHASNKIHLGQVKVYMQNCNQRKGLSMING